MSISSLKQLIRHSIRSHHLGTPVTASQIVTWSNEFLTDIMKPVHRKDAQVVSYRDGVLKVITRSGATSQYLHAFEEEWKNRFMEKFHTIKLSRILYQINRSSNDDSI